MQKHDNAPTQKPQRPTPQSHQAPEPDGDFFLYGRIIDLNSPKVQESYSLLQWSKIQNLKENARRFAFMTENGLLNVDRLAAELSRTRKAFYQKQSQQVSVEKRLKEVNGVLRDVAAFYDTNKIYNQYISIKNPRKQKQFYDEHEREILLNKAANSRILQYRKAHNLAAPPNFPALKKEKAALLKEQERLNGERIALKETMQGMSEAYRAIDEQMRQMQRSRAPKRSRDDNDLS